MEIPLAVATDGYDDSQDSGKIFEKTIFRFISLTNSNKKTLV